MRAFVRTRNVFRIRPVIARFRAAPVTLERPTHIERLIDFMLGASPLASKIDSKHIAFLGSHEAATLGSFC
jgi:hypothetical protein